MFSFESARKHIAINALLFQLAAEYFGPGQIAERLFELRQKARCFATGSAKPLETLDDAVIIHV